MKDLYDMTVGEILDYKFSKKAYNSEDKVGSLWYTDDRCTGFRFAIFIYHNPLKPSMLQVVIVDNSEGVYKASGNMEGTAPQIVRAIEALEKREHTRRVGVDLGEDPYKL